MTNKLSRRQFLRMGATGAAATTLGSGLLPSLAQDDIVLQWWDHFLPLQPLSESVFAAYNEANPNVSVEYTVFSPPDLGKSLQLAFPNGQAPDIHALAGVNLPLPALHKEGWFTPIGPYVTEEWMASLPPEVLIEGRTTFGGELYSFPIFGFRQHAILTWFNVPQLEAAGVDPAVGPVTWDDFRQTARVVTENGGGNVFGWVQGIAHIGRMSATLTQLAQLAGASGEVDWTTGEYAHGSDAYVNALEFLVSMERDGSLFPTGLTIDTRNARARWAAGDGCLFLDGPWNIGVLQNNFAEFMDVTGVSQAPVPEAGVDAWIYANPKSGDFWVSSQTDHPEHAAAILQDFTSEEYQVRLAERMDQPPLDPTAVGKANVHHTYSRAIELFADIARLAPDPLVRNPAVAEALSRMSDVRPNLGEIVQGVVSGEVDDLRGTLQFYADQLSAQRESAVAAAQAAGVDVSLDDWVFSNWQPGQDYTAGMYTES